MIEKQIPEEEIFYRALALGPGEGREEYLEEACGSDAALREEVERLLEAHAEPVSVLNETYGGGETPSDNAIGPIEKPGDFVGRYKLLQQIGEGGFGTVWMAEQSVPITRRVALKIIKLGMDTREVIARFEAERQALAMMDHHHIAKVLDAGATDTGRPFFVMELVRGISITRFCDERKLGTQARLELFLKVCAAVNHAHQKGVIHRDLKPNNILVTLVVDKPVPKVIAFGIAKATHTKLTEKTLFTRFEQFVGTPVYMSPEQAALSGLDIDTRTDIYSLGVLLYELITGKLPFNLETLQAKDYDQLRKIIQDHEPPKPSNRLSTLAEEERTEVASTHQGDPDKLHKLVRNDLDWVVMKAIEKDRTRRYETVNALAMDIQRFLDDEPVTAAAPSTAYRLQRFARRNKGFLAAVSAVVLALSSGLALSLSQMYKAKENADELKRADDFFTEYMEKAVTIMPRLKTDPPPKRYLNGPPLILKFGIRASNTAWDVYEETKWLLQPFRHQLESNMARNVVIEIIVYRDYQKLIDGIAQGDVDFMRSGGYAYILGKYKHGNKIQLLGRHAAERNDDSKDPPGKIIIGKQLKNRGITNMDGLLKAMRNPTRKKDLRVAFGSYFSGSGRIRIQDVLAEHGITAAEVDWYYTARHRDVANAIANEEADFGGLKHSSFDKYFGPDGEHPGKAIFIHEFQYTGLDPTKGGKGKPWSSWGDLDPTLIHDLQKALCEVDLRFYTDYWARNDPGEYTTEDFKDKPPGDYPLPIAIEEDKYYKNIRGVHERSRAFFAGLENRILNDSSYPYRLSDRFIKLTEPQQKLAKQEIKSWLDRLDERDNLSYSVLCIYYFKDLEFAKIAKETQRMEWEVRERHRQSLEAIQRILSETIEASAK